MRARILYIEDDPVYHVLVRGTLPGVDLLVVERIKEAERALLSSQFDAILVDIELPDGNGIDFIFKNISKGILKDIPIVFLTGEPSVSHKVTAFSLGADDFIMKPFEPLELRARLFSKIEKSRRDMAHSEIRRVGDLTIDFAKCKVFLDKGEAKEDLQLTLIETRILDLLSRRQEIVFSREKILDIVWPGTSITDRTVDSHIANLRRKTKGSRVRLVTIKGVGYSIVVQPKQT
ncbi:MAG: response regulator transcription factor [Bdellovibrionales bacterium]|nr:response regulator transcription factor [Bdellovibrionales bacterium]